MSCANEIRGPHVSRRDWICSDEACGKRFDAGNPYWSSRVASGRWGKFHTELEARRHWAAASTGYPVEQITNVLLLWEDFGCLLIILVGGTPEVLWHTSAILSKTTDFLVVNGEKITYSDSRNMRLLRLPGTELIVESPYGQSLTFQV